MSSRPKRHTSERHTSQRSTSYERIAFLASPNEEAKKAHAGLSKRYGNAEPEGANVIVALGGDGFMLQTLHKYMSAGKPIYGMHRGTVGFLMNEYNPDDLHRRLAAAQNTVIHPLLMQARDADGRIHKYHAFNEVSLFRQTSQAAHLRILVDAEVRLAQLIADGVLIATPAGSTAYNLSVQGHSVEVCMDHSIDVHMLFDPGHSLDERILREQFGY
jgi:NAD+ kinase